MRGIERDTECGTGADYRDTVVRTVLFACASLAAWWCCSSVASADEAQPAEHPVDHVDLADLAGDAAPDTQATYTPTAAAPAATERALTGPSVARPAVVERAAAEPVVTVLAESTGPGVTGHAVADRAAAELVVSEPGEPAVTEPQGSMAPSPSPSPSAAPAPESGPVLFPVVVAPLVEAVSPAVAPSGNAVLPVLDAVTTPAAPMLQSVMPVADRIVGPVVGPAAGPAVEVVKPVVEQLAASTAPFVQLVAPVVVPVVEPVTGAVAPVVGGVVSSVADPLAGAAEPALRSVLDVDPRYFGLRPATADFPIDLDPVGDVFEVAGPLALVPLTFEPPVPADRSSAAGDDADGAAGPDGGAVPAAPALAAAPAAAPAPVGGPFRGGHPSSRAAVISQGQPDSSQRSQRLVAVLPASAGTPEVPTTALGRVPVESPLARFGGRPPVTPD